MGFYDAIRVGASGAAGDFTIDRSLRFNNDDSAYLNRTPSSTSNENTYTTSFWVKRSGLTLGGTNHQTIFSCATDNAQIRFHSSDDTLDVLFGGTSSGHLRTTQKFRDISAWYHILVAVDTTQATSSNRVKIYVNGSQVTSFGTETYPSQNLDTGFNSTVAHNIGRSANDSNRFLDGYLAEFNHIDGSQLTPSSFGETDVLAGQWNPKKYAGSYGTNGFYLNFSDNSGTTATTLGKDSSGNGNNFTPNNFSVSAGVGNDSLEDTPTNNFPTFNPIDTSSGTISNGNLDLTTATGSSTNYGNWAIPSSGKWFMESTMTDNGVHYSPFIVATNYLGLSDTTYTDSNLSYYINGQKRLNNAWTNYGAGFGEDDVIGVAIDVDNNQVTFYKNGASQGAISFTFASGVDYFFAASDGSSYGSSSHSWNFGQRPFIHTQPTGFKKLCSANLPDPTIKLPNQHFNTVLYTGNDSSDRDITGVGFQPDWLWIKNRSQADFHMAQDSVRGANKSLYVNDTDIEQTDNANGHVNSFLADGFNVDAGGSGLVNENSENYVAWNWNAGDTDGKTYTVTVVDDSGNKFRFDGYGTSAVTLDLAEGGTYIFNYPSGHPFRFSTTSDGTHGGGSEYTTGVTHNSSTQVTIVVAASAPTLYYYCSSHSGMGGQINTNSTLGSSNFDGTIQSVVKASPTAGFSIINYTGNGSSGSTLGHGLGVAPKAAFVKRRDGGSNWISPFFDLQTAGKLNATDTLTNSYYNTFFTSQPSSTLLTIGSNDDINRNTSTYVAYVFSEVAGYSKFGSYKGNGNADGTFVFTGFRPAFILFKNSSTTTNWEIYDTKRPYGEYNPAFRPLYANHSYSEETHASLPALDILSNGFKPRSTWDEFNKNGDTIIYLAFAESPFKYSRAR